MRAFSGSATASRRKLHSWVRDLLPPLTRMGIVARCVIARESSESSAAEPGTRRNEPSAFKLTSHSCELEPAATGPIPMIAPRLDEPGRTSRREPGEFKGASVTKPPPTFVRSPLLTGNASPLRQGCRGEATEGSSLHGEPFPGRFQGERR